MAERTRGRRKLYDEGFSTSVLFSRYQYGDNMKEDEESWVYSTHG
jgi:hypothetical protein